MRVVLTLFSREIHRCIAPAILRWLAGAILGLETLRRRPGFNQRAIDREVLGRDQSVPLRQTQHLAEEGARHRFVEQAVPILRERTVIPDLVIHIQANKPAIEQVVVNVLHQLPLRPNRVQRLDQTGPQQPLRRNRRAPRLGVQLFEVRMQRRQKTIYQHPQFAQRMRGRNPLLQGSVAEHLRLAYVGTAHEIATSLNSKDKLYHLHGICGVFQRPVNTQHPQSGLQINAIGVVVVTHDDKPITRNAPSSELTRNAAIQITLAFMRHALEMLTIHPPWKQARQPIIEQCSHGWFFKQGYNTTFHQRTPLLMPSNNPCFHK